MVLFFVENAMVIHGNSSFFTMEGIDVFIVGWAAHNGNWIHTNANPISSKKCLQKIAAAVLVGENYQQNHGTDDQDKGPVTKSY